MSGNCWNPNGSIDWHNVGVFYLAGGIISFASPPSAWYFCAPLPCSLLNASTLSKASPPTLLSFLRAFSAELRVCDSHSVNHQSLRKEEWIWPSITTHLSSSPVPADLSWPTTELGLTVPPLQQLFPTFAWNLKVLCSGRCSLGGLDDPGFLHSGKQYLKSILVST